MPSSPEQPRRASDRVGATRSVRALDRDVVDEVAVACTGGRGFDEELHVFVVTRPSACATWKIVSSARSTRRQHVHADAEIARGLLEQAIPAWTAREHDKARNRTDGSHSRRIAFASVNHPPTSAGIPTGHAKVKQARSLQPYES